MSAFDAPRLPAVVTPEAIRLEAERSPKPPPDPLARPDEVTFTIAITVWRREHLLPRALQSVLRQEDPCSELLVLADGPSRRARELSAAFGEVFNVRYEEVRRRRKTHGNHLRRQALRAATATHVVILGHDCLLHTGYLAAHRRNLAGNRDGLSVVPVDYWRGSEPDGRMPRSDDVMAVGEGQIDLLCLALPRRLALQEGCFCEDMMRVRCADFLSFDLLRHRTRPIFRGGEPLAAHF